MSQFACLKLPHALGKELHTLDLRHAAQLRSHESSAETSRPGQVSG